MNIKIKKISIKMSIVLAMLLFACNSGSRPPTQTDVQRLQTTSVATADTVQDSGEVNDNETTDMDSKIVNESITANDETTVADTKTVNENSNKKDEFVPLWMPYPLVDVKPLLNGKAWSEELHKHFKENQKFQEIAEKAGIKDKWSVSYLFFIDGDDGSVVDVSVFINDQEIYITEENMEEPSFQQLLAAEMLRLLKDTQGKWTPAKHKGKPMKVRIGGTP